MSRCDWITCTAEATVREAQWSFCRPHGKEHRLDDLSHLFDSQAPKDRQQCGTPAGYSMHRQRDELACRPCLDAHNQDNRRYKALSTRRTQPCGTYGGYRRHQNEKTPVCDACREANRAYGRALRQRRNAS